MSGYRSGLEGRFARLFPDAPYEQTRLPYVVTHQYCPDFEVGPNHFVEVKGLFDSADRSKHLAIKRQHPDVKITFVFQNPKLKLSKASRTTYADWCDAHGFDWLHINDAAQLATTTTNKEK